MSLPGFIKRWKTIAYETAANGQIEVFPDDSSQLAQVMAEASKEGYRVIPEGLTSALTAGGEQVLITNLSRMHEIVEVDRENMVAIAQSGCKVELFQERMRELGYYFPPDPPLPGITLAALVADGGGGLHECCYGPVRKYILGMDFVTAGGKISTFGGKNVKDVSGYDFTHFVVGSGYNLGMPVKLYLRLLPYPEDSSTVIAIFASPRDACRAAARITTSGDTPARLEVISSSLVDRLNKDFTLPDGGRQTLFLAQIEGFKYSLDRRVRNLVAVLEQEGGQEVRTAEGAEENEIWQGRQSLGKKLSECMLLDLDVLPGRLPDLVEGIVQEAEDLKLEPSWLAHGGCGNVHLVLQSSDGPWEELAARLAERTFQLEGSIQETGKGRVSSWAKGFEFPENVINCIYRDFAF